jgi:hypothetical protein
MSLVYIFAVIIAANALLVLLSRERPEDGRMRDEVDMDRVLGDVDTSQFFHTLLRLPIKGECKVSWFEDTLMPRLVSKFPIPTWHDGAWIELYDFTPARLSPYFTHGDLLRMATSADGSGHDDVFRWDAIRGGTWRERIFA